jgi:hypothetical protein
LSFTSCVNRITISTVKKKIGTNVSEVEDSDSKDSKGLDKKGKSKGRWLKESKDVKNTPVILIEVCPQ